MGLAPMLVKNAVHGLRTGKNCRGKRQKHVAVKGVRMTPKSGHMFKKTQLTCRGTLFRCATRATKNQVLKYLN